MQEVIMKKVLAGMLACVWVAKEFGEYPLDLDRIEAEINMFERDV